MDYFYKSCADALFQPLLEFPDFKNITGELAGLLVLALHLSIPGIDSQLTLTRERTNLYLHLCDLLSGFALQHSFRSHFFLLSSSIASHVASLLRAKDKHLRLGTYSSALM